MLVRQRIECSGTFFDEATRVLILIDALQTVRPSSMPAGIPRPKNRTFLNWRKPDISALR